MLSRNGALNTWGVFIYVTTFLELWKTKNRKGLHVQPATLLKLLILLTFVSLHQMTDSSARCSILI